MGQDYQLQFDLLIDEAIRIGNRLNKVKTTNIEESLRFAEGLGQKVLQHILSIRKLFNADGLSLNGNLYAPQVDFSSIAVLTRAAMETYLTLNFIYVSVQNEDERKFRFTCWHLAGFLEREQFKSKSKLHAIIQEDERIEIERLKEALTKMPHFINLNQNQKLGILKGKWKIFKSWRDLAVLSGFNESFFQQYYSYLCSYAHSGRLSILQIKQTRDCQSQTEMAESSILILMVILAKFMFDYIQIMPDLKSANIEPERRFFVDIWKNAADNLR